MFRSSNNLSEFLSVYWKDIHHLTGDIMDIYYTDEDFKHNTSCYDKVKKFSYLKLKEEVFPSIIVWSQCGEYLDNIVLKNLANDEIIDTLEYLVKKAKENEQFEVIVNQTKDFTNQIRDSKKNIVNKYIYEGCQIGASGTGAISQYNVFRKGESEELEYE